MESSRLKRTAVTGWVLILSDVYHPNDAGRSSHRTFILSEMTLILLAPVVEWHLAPPHFQAGNGWASQAGAIQSQILQMYH